MELPVLGVTVSQVEEKSITVKNKLSIWAGEQLNIGNLISFLIHKILNYKSTIHCIWDKSRNETLT